MSFESILEITDLSIQKLNRTDTNNSLLTKEKMAAVQTMAQEAAHIQESSNFKVPESRLAYLSDVEDAGYTVLQLPSDFLKTPATTYQPEYCIFALPSCLTEFLEVQAQQEDIDSRSLLLAAFNALLYRYTQQETIHLDLTIPDTQISTNDTRGICTQISGELKIRELISHISIALKGIAEKSAALQPQLAVDNFNRPANLPIAITFIEKLLYTEEEQWMSWFGQHSNEEFTKLESATELTCGVSLTHNPDLHLVILQQQQSISGILIYNANLFKPETIKRLSGHLQVLVEGIVNDLDSSISQLPLLTQAEEHQLLSEWKGASVSYPQVPIYQHIEKYALQQPEAIALTSKEQKLSYAQLNQRVNQLAHYLNSVGVGAEVRVAVCVQPSLEIVVSLLGVLKAGGVYVPLDQTYPTDRLTTILEDTHPHVLLTQSQLLPKLPAMAEHIFCLDQDWEKIQHLPTHNPENKICPDQTAYIIYTSGTTGKPKGVMASHSNLINYILVAQERFGFDSHDVMSAIARFTFSITMFELLSPLVAGGTLVILEREHILDFKQMAQTLEQLTVMHASPSLMQKLLAYIKDNALDVQRFQNLKHVSVGGDMVSAELLETMRNVFQSAEIYVIYGCSEISCMGCSYPVANQSVTTSRVGKPFNNVAVLLYDPQQNLVPIGIPGEIYISGAGITKGYLNQEELTQEKFVTINGQRFYRTGDLGRFDADGNLEILGRADFQIKLRGIRIELGDIETTLRQAPGVREGVVMARELGNSEKSLVAYIVLDRTKNSSIEDIRLFLQAKLPDYMVPTAFVVLEAIPLSPNLKVDRRALPMPTLENMAGLKTFVPPQNELEKQMTEIWENVLGIQPIGIQNNFFELGGDSLLAVQLFTLVDKLLGRSLPITTLVHSPTIESLVKVLHNPQEEMMGDLVPLRQSSHSNSKPPLFCIYGILLYRELVEQLDSDQSVYGVYLQEEIDLLKTGNAVEQDSLLSSVPKIAARYLQAIRTLQPHGPYYLVGESFGGVVAFEMAQQLKAIGEEIALVAMFDSNAPNAHTQMPLVQRLKLHWQFMLKQGLSYPMEKVQRKFFPILRNLSQKLHPSAESIPHNITEAAQQDIREQARLQASQSYTPQTYSGKVLLFRATERDAFDADRDRDLGWGAWAVGDLQVFDVPGDHLGILKSPNVQVLAEKLKLYLQ